MISIKELVMGKKSVPYITLLTEETREGIVKSYIPKFLYKPPFGYPRFANMTYIRWLATTPYVEMCISTIIDELCSIEWDIIPSEGLEDESDEKEISHIKNFFNNPNSNKESFEEVFIRMPVRDLLEVNTGVLNKVFNLKEEMVEVIARDASTFTKNPDIHGMMTDREDILLPKEIMNNPGEVVNPFQQMSQYVAREAAAYFQYGWISGPVPVPFGKKEIVWLQKMLRSDDHYGQSPVQILAKNLQMLMYQIDSDLEYYNDNNVPKGIIGLDQSDSEELDAFKEQWYEKQRKKDEFGNWKKIMHKVPIVNRIPKFTRIEFSASELQLIEKQKWYTKMVWATMGVTATELGYTEDAQGQSNQIVQSKVFRKKAINPMLRLMEARYNSEIVSEFGYVFKNSDGLEIPKYEFKFKLFDIDEERNKAELYKLQTETFKTVNEVRIIEGLETIEGGDEAPKSSSQNSFSFGDFGEKPFSDREHESQETDDARKTPEPKLPAENNKKLGEQVKEKKGLFESKPFAQYVSFDDCVSKNRDKDDPEAFCAAIMDKVEGKAVKITDPLVLKENEKIEAPERLSDAIIYLLEKNEKIVKDLVSKEINSDMIKQVKSGEVKSLDQLAKKIKGLLSFNGLKGVTQEFIRNNFYKGHEEAERDLDRNFVPDPNAINYISEYTFENINGLNNDLVEKLRGELQRAFMTGEGVGQIKSRVSKIFDLASNRAEAIARTEALRASNTGKILAYQKSGVIGQKKYLAALDHRTSPLCKRLHGQVKSLDEPFVDPDGEWEGNVPPAHVNCRSTWVFIPKNVVDDKDYSLKSGLADQELGFLVQERTLKLLDRKNKLIGELESDLHEGS